MTRSSRLTVGFLLIAAATAYGQLPGLDNVLPYTNPGGALAPSPNIPRRPVQCLVTSQPLTVRVEGLSELLGDIVITCNGFLRANPRNRAGGPAGTPSQAAVAILETINIGVTLSVPVTSRLVADPLTEVLLFINDPDVPTVSGASTAREQNPCAGTAGVCTGLGAHDGNFDNVGGTPGSVADGLAGSAVNIITVGGNQFATGTPVNVFQANRTNNQTVSFQGVPLSSFDTRGNPRLLAAYNAILAANANVYSGQELLVPWSRTFRIKNLRGAIAGAASVNTQVFANIQIQNPSGELQLNTASAVVGQVLQGLSFRLRNTLDSDSPATGLTALASCVTVNRDLAVDATDADPFNGGNFLAQFTEGYGAAFRIRGYAPGQPRANDQFLPNRNYETESGFYNTVWAALPNGLGTAGIADAGTRLRLVFRNVPANVRIYTSVGAVVGTSATVGGYAIVDGTTVTVPQLPTASPNVGAFAGTALAGAAIPALAFVGIGSPQGVTNIPLTNGSGTAFWEIYAAQALFIEKINFAVAVAYRAASNPGLGTATVQGTFAPINTTAVASGPGVPIPRFVETGSPVTAFSIAPCLTNLLFPYITNQIGFNTGLAISNTSLTNPGTGELFSLDANNGVAPQQGTCTLNYFGTTGPDGAAPPPATTAVIPAGRTFVMTLASGSTGPLGNVPAAQNFQGYMIAQCNFRYAHGYAFIADLAFANLAQGYSALIMDGALGSRTGNLSESLSK